MLHFIEIILAVGIIILVVPQTPTDNMVLRKVVDAGLFTNYSKAKEFLILLTWSLIFVFLLILFVLNIDF